MRTANCERPDAMRASSPSTSTVDRAGLEGPHDVGGQLGRQHGDAVAVAGDRDATR